MKDVTSKTIIFFFSQIGIQINNIDVPDRSMNYGPIFMTLFNNTDPRNASYLGKKTILIVIGNYSFYFQPTPGTFID